MSVDVWEYTRSERMHKCERCGDVFACEECDDVMRRSRNKGVYAEEHKPCDVNFLWLCWSCKLKKIRKNKAYK
jgi:hypothetical protein